jgi:hypothetical protein
MKLNKYITLSVFLFSGAVTLCHAEQINMNGAVAEFTCTQQSQDQACQDMQQAVSKLKAQQNTQESSVLEKQTTHIATINIENTENQYNKVLVINYN